MQSEKTLRLSAFAVTSGSEEQRRNQHSRRGLFSNDLWQKVYASAHAKRIAAIIEAGFASPFPAMENAVP
jgi:hypothetical protein